jgi:hypothetical protein
MPPTPPQQPPVSPAPSPPETCLPTDGFEITAENGIYLIDGSPNNKLFAPLSYRFTAPVSHPVRFISSSCDGEIPVTGGTSFYKDGFPYFVGSDMQLDLTNCNIGVITLWCYFHGPMGAIERLEYHPSCAPESPAGPPPTQPSPS